MNEDGCAVSIMCTTVIIFCGILLLRGCGPSQAPAEKPQVKASEAPAPKAEAKVERWREARERLPDFSYGTFAFWALVVIEVLVLVALTEYEKGIIGIVSIAIFLAVVQWLGRSDPLGYAWGHPGRVAAGVAGYYGIGVGWGFAKWFLFIQDRKHLYEEAKAGWLMRRGIRGTSVIPIVDRPAWRDYLERNPGARELSERPLARRNKNRIVNWISFWPVSMLWSFLANFVKGIAKAIYYQLAGWFQSISDSQWKGIDAELRGTEEAKQADPEI